MKKILTVHFIGGSTMEINKTEAVEQLLEYLDGPNDDSRFVKLPNRSGEEFYINLKLVSSVEVKSI